MLKNNLFKNLTPYEVLQNKGQILTAEFVSPKHPDKICDRIADTLLDEYIKQDPKSKVAIEVAAGHGEMFIFGEVGSCGKLQEEFIKNLAQEIAQEKLAVHVNIEKQSPEIARGVDKGGAGDQGIMTGYACRENELFVPNEYYLAASLNKFIYKHFPYDGKTQVSVKGSKVFSVVASFQNSRSSDLSDLVQSWTREISKKQNLDFSDAEFFLNPAGDWSRGGFFADSGLTGRKIVVDNYGPRVPVGGGAFSGKDPSKVDRSAAYMARHLALKILKENPKVKEVLVQLAYAIGVPEPVAYIVFIDSKSQNPDKYFNLKELTSKKIIQTLNLYTPIYHRTTTSHFLNPTLPWNKF